VKSSSGAARQTSGELPAADAMFYLPELLVIGTPSAVAVKSSRAGSEAASSRMSNDWDPNEYLERDLYVRPPNGTAVVESSHAAAPPVISANAARPSLQSNMKNNESSSSSTRPPSSIAFTLPPEAATSSSLTTGGAGDRQQTGGVGGGGNDHNHQQQQLTMTKQTPRSKDGRSALVNVLQKVNTLHVRRYTEFKTALSAKHAVEVLESILTEFACKFRSVKRSEVAYKIKLEISLAGKLLYVRVELFPSESGLTSVSFRRSRSDRGGIENRGFIEFYRDVYNRFCRTAEQDIRGLRENGTAGRGALLTSTAGTTARDESSSVSSPPVSVVGPEATASSVSVTSPSLIMSNNTTPPRSSTRRFSAAINSAVH